MVGENVVVRTGAVTHGSLTVTIKNASEVSQPNPFGDGETVVLPQTEVSVTQEANRMFVFEASTTLDEIVRAVNQI